MRLHLPAILTVVMLLGASYVHAQGPQVTQVPLTDQEADNQVRINSFACKQTGLDDGGATCAAAQELNKKINEARAAKKPAAK